MTTTKTPSTMTSGQRASLAELGARKAVAELHPELHAEFRAAWKAGLTHVQASEWLHRLGLLPNADSDTYTLGLREARAKGLDDDLAGMHPRQAAVLADIPAEDRAVVAASARLTQNMCGGIFSGCLHSAASEYRRIGAAELARRDRLTNARAMQWLVDADGYRIEC